MKYFVLGLALLMLSACATGGTLQVACTFDQLAPGGIATVGAIATIADPTFAATAAQMTEADKLAHPLVQAACAAIPGQPAPLVVPVPGNAAPVPGTPIVLSATGAPTP